MEMRPEGLPGFEVILVRWPEEIDRIERLRTLGVPRLLLVGGDLSTLKLGDALEDWVRLPAPEDELRIRVANLALRARETREKPTVDEDGLLRYGGRWIALSPTERSLAATLVDCFGDVVDHETLVRITWKGRRPTRNALVVHITRLRRRFAPLGLEICTVRGCGYILQSVAVSGVG
jgi:DNA-binding response OmpR family regulator